MHCKSCGMEYNQGVEICSDCGARLDPGPLAVRELKGEDWVSLLRLRNESKARIILGYLRNYEIPCEMINKTLSEMPIPASTFSAYYEIWVPKAAVEDAAALLNDSEEGTTNCPACDHLSSAEEARCEYCREPLGIRPS